MSTPSFPEATPAHHLAQVNVGRVLEPLDSARMAGFVEWLEPINAIADASPGFVWRLQTEEGDATALRPFPDDRMLINMSTWESLPALWDFVYLTSHLDALRRRREWFERLAEASVALWWVPAGERPSVTEAIARVERLEREGPGPHAFTFKQPYAPSVTTDRVPAPNPGLQAG